MENLEQYEQAIADYEKALEVQPGYHESLFSKGVAFSQLKFYQQAIVAYERAIEIKSDDNFTIINLGLVKYEIGKVDEAIEHWQAVIEINNQLVEPQLAIGVALYNKGEISEGLTIAEIALKLDKSWGNLQRLKKELWGEKLLADAGKLLENPQIKALLSQTENLKETAVEFEQPEDQLDWENSEEIDEQEWLHATAKNPVFDFLKDPEEDIYTLTDGKPFTY